MSDHDLRMINRVGGAFSFVGSLFVLSCYILFPRLRHFGSRLIFALALSDFFYATNGFMDPAEDSDMCIVQAVVTQFFSLTAVLWVAIIARVLHRMYIQQQMYEAIEQSEPRYHLFCWGVGVILTIIPNVTKSYGMANGWCWLKDDLAGNIYRFATFYVILWVVLIYLIYVYFALYWQLGSPQEAAVMQVPEAERQRRRRLFWFPCLLIVCYTAPSINRIWQLTSTPSPAGLTVVHLFGLRFRGFFNSILYGINEAVRQEVGCVCEKRQIHPNENFDQDDQIDQKDFRVHGAIPLDNHSSAKQQD